MIALSEIPLKSCATHDGAASLRFITALITLRSNNDRSRTCMKKHRFLLVADLCVPAGFSHSLYILLERCFGHFVRERIPATLPRPLRQSRPKLAPTRDEFVSGEKGPRRRVPIPTGEDKLEVPNNERLRDGPTGPYILDFSTTLIHNQRPRPP